MENDQKDVGFIDDAVDLISDLACAETHLARTSQEAKKGNEQLIELLTNLRRDRSALMNTIIPENSGEFYCTVKHLSKVSRNWEELANRMLEQEKREISEKKDDLAKVHHTLAVEYLEKSRVYHNVCKILIELAGENK